MPVVRPSAPAARPCGRGGRRGSRGSRGTPPCRRTRRRSPPGRRRPDRGRDRAPASAPCARSTGTAASRGSRCPRRRAGWRSSPAARGRAAPGTPSGRCPRSPGRPRRSRRRGRPCRSGTSCRSPWPRAGRAPRAAARSGAGRRPGRPGPGPGPGAATSATGSATCRISSATSAGWSSTIRATTFSPGMSAAVTTTTLDQSNAGSRSIPSSLACGSVARTVRPCHAPGTTRSSVKRAAPVSLSRPSRRSGERAFVPLPVPIADRVLTGRGSMCGRDAARATWPRRAAEASVRPSSATPS